MNMLEEAIIYATVLHQGKKRKREDIPYILHPLEVAQILSTLTDKPEVLAAGVLHDVVEDTDGTLSEIRQRFGDRVAELVASETENKYPEEDSGASWKKRKEESLQVLKHTKDIGVKMLWLADKLSNIRSFFTGYSELGENLWDSFNQKDPELHRWYYKTVAEYIEYDLNRTAAYKEFILRINYIWPGTFDSAKSRYRKYREVSIEGCEKIGSGFKGDVYRYDDETIIKVYNENNTYKDVEQEIALARKAFIIGLPTAISFGIVSVGKRYGAMFELLNTMTISERIARDTSQVPYYAKVMANLAHQIHDTRMTGDDDFPDASERLRQRLENGIMRENEVLGQRVRELIDALPPTRYLTHGDFHSNNVFIVNGEPLLVDMDRLSTGHPIVDLSGMYLSYIAFGETHPDVVANYMGFPYEKAQQFFFCFLKEYLQTADENRIRTAAEKAALLASTRMISHIRKKGRLSPEDKAEISRLVNKVEKLLTRVDNLLV